IVADAGFVALLGREGLGLPIKMSTGAAVFSAATLRFFRRLGADGFVLPRHLSVAEVLAVRRDTRGEADLEVFLMNTRCPYEDGLCGFSHYIPQGAVDRALHSPAMPAKVGRLVRELPLIAEIAPQRRRFGCGMEYDFEDGEEDAELARRAADRGTETPVEADLLHLLSACGACAVWDLARGGVDAAKVVGRALPLRRKLRDVGIVREAIRLALAIEDRSEFAAEMRDRFAKARGRPCTRADCYYPEQDNGHGT
ncbi:MAG: U32 family peptidase, partial [Candidatus Methylomirabilis sp.]|nr:U32 family peptidase [Deltaproteobacteria bacterium]